MKTCKDCLRELPEESFYLDRKWGKRKKHCRECAKAKVFAWREANPERYKQYQDAYSRSETGRQRRNEGNKRWHRDNRAKVNAGMKRWRDKNPLMAAEYGRRRYMRKRGTARIVGPEVLNGRKAMFGGRCWMCGAPAEQMDHVKPLDKGGLHLGANLRPACRLCNGRKTNRWPVETTSILSRAKVRIPA